MKYISVQEMFVNVWNYGNLPFFQKLYLSSSEYRNHPSFIKFMGPECSVRKRLTPVTYF